MKNKWFVPFTFTAQQKHIPIPRQQNSTCNNAIHLYVHVLTLDCIDKLETSKNHLTTLFGVDAITKQHAYDMQNLRCVYEDNHQNVISEFAK